MARDKKSTLTAKTNSFAALATFVWTTVLLFSSTVSAQQYRVGDIVENFTLINRANNQEVSLQDFEGKIVFLEWFAYWCPFCQAAAEQVESGIVSHYATREGNPNGIPVMHVAINLQGGAENQTQTFVNEYNIQLVLNDFNSALANRFQSGGQPIFAIINGVANSPSHDQWELIYSRLGYGNTDHPINEFRTSIDSVQAAATGATLSITSQPKSARIATGRTLALSVEATGENLSYQWSKDSQSLEGETGSSLTVESTSLDDSGIYSVVVSNTSEEITSSPAEIRVILSLVDYLTEHGLTGDEMEPSADPDKDGKTNIFEYLAQTDPSDSGSVPSLSTNVVSTESGYALELNFPVSEDNVGIELEARFWTNPEDALPEVKFPVSTESTVMITQDIPTSAKSLLGQLIAQPTEEAP